MTIPAGKAARGLLLLLRAMTVAAVTLITVVVKAFHSKSTLLLVLFQVWPLSSLMT
jgi:hypothetical protein